MRSLTHIKIIIFLLIFIPTSFLAYDEPNSANSNATTTVTNNRPNLEELEKLKAQITDLKVEYEKRIHALEEQVEQLQLQLIKVTPETTENIAQAPTPAPTPEKTVQTTAGALNPAIAVVGNFLGRIDDNRIYHEGTRIDNKLNLREAEIDMRVPIDPFADGVLITSLESEVPGQFTVSIEEGYFTLKKLPFLDQPPLGLKFKVGHFRPAFGKYNILHTHDLPQSFRPLPIKTFLGEEGFTQNGISANFFIPTPWDANASLDATIEVLNGGNIAISPYNSSRMSYLGHLRYFRTIKDTNNLEIGWSSYIRPSGVDLERVNLQGLDIMYRWKPLRLGEYKSFLLGGELFFSPREYPQYTYLFEKGKPKGGTVFSQWQFNKRLYSGARWDRTTFVDYPKTYINSITPYFSYYLSEFLRFRVNYEHSWGELGNNNPANSLFFEFNWIFGSHPPEPYWVNK